MPIRGLHQVGLDKKSGEHGVPVHAAVARGGSVNQQDFLFLWIRMCFLEKLAEYQIRGRNYGDVVIVVGKRFEAVFRR